MLRGLLGPLNVVMRRGNIVESESNLCEQVLDLVGNDLE